MKDTLRHFYRREEKKYRDKRDSQRDPFLPRLFHSANELPIPSKCFWESCQRMNDSIHSFVQFLIKNCNVGRAFFYTCHSSLRRIYYTLIYILREYISRDEKTIDELINTLIRYEMKSRDDTNKEKRRCCRMIILER